MMATTFAIVAVFVPVAFMGGMIGKFFLPVRHHRRGRGDGVAVRELHARPDAVLGLARSRGGPLPPRAVAGQRDGTRRSASSNMRIESTTACCVGR